MQHVRDRLLPAGDAETGHPNARSRSCGEDVWGGAAAGPAGHIKASRENCFAYPLDFGAIYKVLGDFGINRSQAKFFHLIKGKETKSLAFLRRRSAAKNTTAIKENGYF